MKKKSWIYIALFAGILLILLANATRYYGFTDEADNFLAGLSLVSGQRIYVEFTSQHMPLLYYICAVFYWLGARNAFQFRLYFYVFFALLWLLFYWRNQKKFGVIASVSVPLLYVCNMYTYFTSCALSDHMQAFGMAVLLFEFCDYCREKEVDWGRAVWVALGILLSFGTAFVSAFGIAAIVFGVLWIEILSRRNNDKKFGENLADICNKYKWLFAFSIAPFVLYIVIYAGIGHLEDLIFGAFRLNTEYYSQYTGGYGTSAVSALTDPFVNYLQGFKNAVLNLPAAKVDSLKILGCYGINFIFLAKTWKKSRPECVALTCFMVLCGSRGFGYEFHALPYYAVTVGMMGMLLQEAWEERQGRMFLKVVTIGITIVLIFPFVRTLRDISRIPGEWEARNQIEEGSYEYYLARLTDEEEEFFLATIRCDVAVNANRVSLTSPVSTPWTYHGYPGLTMQNLERQRPRVALYNPDYSVWGYYMRDYASDVTEYMQENYRPLNIPDCPDLYVRNDYYEEALKKSGFPYETIQICPRGTGIIDSVLDMEIEQTIVGNGMTVDCLGLMAGTYARTNDSELSVIIREEDTGRELISQQVSVLTWKDNYMNYMEFPEILLEEGKVYVIEIEPLNASLDTSIALYYSQDGQEDTFVEINGERQGYDLCYGLFYRIDD
jgi:hypothetical protein